MRAEKRLGHREGQKGGREREKTWEQRVWGLEGLATLSQEPAPGAPGGGSP